MEHKNQACFVAPQVKTNYSNGVSFKEKSPMITSANLFNNLNSQSSQLSIKSLVQKVSLMNGESQQTNGNYNRANGNYNQTNGNYNQTNGINNSFEQTTNNCAYDLNKVKVENDSNESTDRQLSITNYTNSLNFTDIRSIKMNSCYNLGEINQLNDQNGLQNSLQNGLGNLGLNFNYNLNNLNSFNGLNAFNGLAGINSLQSLNTINNIKTITSTQQTNGKRGSGRRPSSLKEDKLSPEEEERRKVRRERNKQAAARCRKRRVEHTNTLEQQTQGLETKKRSLNEQIRQLELEANQLLSLLKHHDCKMLAVAEKSSN